MPRRRSAASSSLRRLAIVNISHHMEDYWLADFAENFLNQGNFLYVIGPFECLTPSLICELFDTLVKEGLLKRYFLQVLLDTRLKHLNLSQAKSVANKDSVVKLVETRCQKLTHLNLSMLNKVSGRAIGDLVTHLPVVTHLNLSQTKTSDQVLAMLGNNSNSLIDLNLSCCPVTDMGVMSLCVSFDPKMTKCAKLSRLNLGCTGVTLKGVEIVLKNVPKLQYLIHNDTCDVLYQMHWMDQDNKCVPPEQQYMLRCLYRSHLTPTLIPVSTSVQISVAYCPYVTEVYFTQGATNQCLLLLTSLKLHVLSVANSEEGSVTFEGGLFPLLQTSGQELIELDIFEINQVDFGAIALCCPNLKKFSCLVAGYEEAFFPMNTHPELKSINTPKCFTQLEQVRVLLHTQENSFPEQFLRLLIKNSYRLKHLHLAFIQSLTDHLFNELLRENPLPDLEKVIFESCHEVTQTTVGQLVNMPSNLRQLFLNDCKQITRRDFDSFTRVVKENNYDLEIEWS